MKNPEIYTIETGDSSDEKKPPVHTERKLDSIDTAETEKYEALHLARERLIGNEDLYKKFIVGFVKSYDSIPVELSSVINTFTSYCIELSDDEIDALVRQFNSGAVQYLIKNDAKIGIDQQKKEALLSAINRIGINSAGIISTVKYIRSRRQLFKSEPQQEYSFYFEDNLDARYKIDLIEVMSIDGKTSIMNLIQIKSHEPSGSEEDAINRDHNSWIHSVVLDFETFEREYTDGIPDELTIEKIVENAEEVEALLLDICTDPSGFSADKFLAGLDLGSLNNKQKAWVLLKFSQRVKDKVTECIEKGIIDTEQAGEILLAIDKLTDKVTSKAKLPKDLSFVSEVNSIIAVGPKIISEKNIFKESEDENKMKVIKKRV